ncbi:tubulin domain-containing protein [Aspergillus karnatakaensis]|uniref:misato family protein n=1 Tax=Aspergillus karnatakaensis TaxID=1810916 RepID=UPI003CCE061F
MHEILTVQLGQRANYLATHFWNIQESYFTYGGQEESPVNHDVHFRPGVGADGSETYTPRTLIYDLKGAFGTLRKNNALYELSEDLAPGQGLWDGKEILQKLASIPQSDYQKSLDSGTAAPQLSSETVRFWSDYNRVFYHPRSIVQLNDYELNSSIMPFEDWSLGEDLFNDIDKEHDLLDRDIRPFAEECDQLRALQIFTSADDAWGGFAARYVDRLIDEYGKKAVLVWAIEDGKRAQHATKLKREMNKARSLYSISPQTTMYTPILDPPSRLPNTLRVNNFSGWYTSALVSMAMESVTLPTRLRPHHDFEALLSGDDSLRRIFELQASIIPPKEDQGHEGSQSTRPEVPRPGSSKARSRFHLDFTYDLPDSDNSHIFNQLQVLRGAQPEEGENEEPVVEDLGMARKMRLYNSEPMFHRLHTPLQYPILDSFPHDMLTLPTPGDKISIVAALTASTRTADRIRGLESVAGRAFAVDERENLVNGLGEIRESYETGWMSDSDFDDN